MAAKKYIVELEATERTRLHALISKGKAAAKRILKAQTIWTARAIKAGWKKQARLASVQLARTRHSQAVLERRATEHVIRFGPRIGHFLAQHTPARTGSS